MLKISWIILIISFIYFIHINNAFHESFNFIIPSSKRSCFYQELERNSPAYKVEVFLLSGGSLDIFLTFHGPLIESDIMNEFFEDPIFHDSINAFNEIDSDTLTYTTEFKPTKPGTYAICLDNRKSRFLSKTVQLDVRPLIALEPPIITIQDTEPDEVDTGKLKESLISLGTIYNGIINIQKQQQRDRHRLSLHSETNNTNYSKVISGSLFETFIFIIVSIFQIYFIRRWFISRNINNSMNNKSRA